MLGKKGPNPTGGHRASGQHAPAPRAPHLQGSAPATTQLSARTDHIPLHRESSNVYKDPAEARGAVQPTAGKACRVLTHQNRGEQGCRPRVSPELCTRGPCVKGGGMYPWGRAVPNQPGWKRGPCPGERSRWLAGSCWAPRSPGSLVLSCAHPQGWRSRERDAGHCRQRSPGTSEPPAVSPAARGSD